MVIRVRTVTTFGAVSTRHRAVYEVRETRNEYRLSGSALAATDMPSSQLTRGHHISKVDPFPAALAVEWVKYL